MKSDQARQIRSAAGRLPQASGRTEPLLRLEDLSCVIPTDRGDVHALTDVSFDLEAGQVLGIVGESGSGKSTMAKMIVGARPPRSRVSGRVLLNGVDLQTAKDAASLRGRRIGMVFQDPMMALNPVVPVGRQIAEAARHHLGLNRSDAQSRAVQLLRQVGIPDPERRLSMYPHQFSGGLRQRITIAMALSCEPELLIADEATTALDVTVQRQILDLLADLSEQRSLAMILVSHDLSVVAGRADYTAVMYAGRIVEMATSRDLFTVPAHPYTAALLDAIPRVDGVKRQRLRSIEGQPPDLTKLRDACAFAPRCPRRTEECTESEPELGNHAPGHLLRCYHPLS